MNQQCRSSHNSGQHHTKHVPKRTTNESMIIKHRYIENAMTYTSTYYQQNEMIANSIYELFLK